MDLDFQELELFENWKPIPGWEGFYEVSDWGRVRSVARIVPHSTGGQLSIAGRLMIQEKRPNGYRCVTFSKSRKHQRFYVHRLIALAFIGPCPLGKEIDHIDADRTHNSVKNLRYVTRTENNLHAVALGRQGKLTPEQRIEICRLSKEGMSQEAIAKIFGVFQTTIGRIIRKKARVKP